MLHVDIKAISLSASQEEEKKKTHFAFCFLVPMCSLVLEEKNYIAQVLQTGKAFSTCCSD